MPGAPRYRPAGAPQPKDCMNLGAARTRKYTATGTGEISGESNVRESAVADIGHVLVSQLQVAAAPHFARSLSYSMHHYLASANAAAKVNR